MDESSDHNFMEALLKKVKHRSRIKEVANQLLSCDEYTSAREVLYKLLSLHDNPEEVLETLMKIAECDIMLSGRIAPATDEEIMENIHSSGKSYQDCRDTAQQLSGLSSLIMYFYTCRVARLKDHPDSAMKTIEICALTVTNEIEELMKDAAVKRKAVKATYLMIEIAEQAIKIVGADEELAAISYSISLVRIGYVLNEASKYKEAKNIMMTGRDRMLRHFGDHAKKYHRYASLANNIGYALAHMSEFDEAAKYHEEAIASVVAAVDIAEADRQSALQMYRNGLQHDRKNSQSWHMKDRGTKEYAKQEPYVPPSFTGGRRQSKTRTSGRDNTFPSDTGGTFVFNEREAVEKKRPEHALLDSLEAAIFEVENSGQISEKTDRTIRSLLDTNSISWEMIRDMARDKAGTSAVILNFYAAKRVSFSELPNKAIAEIDECVQRAERSISDVIQQNRAISATNLAPLLYQMISVLRGVRTGQKDLKATVEARSLDRLGSIYLQLSRYDLAIDHLTEGLKVMSDHFGEIAVQQSVYASLTHNIGCAYDKLKDYSKSAKFYADAVAYIEQATDITEAEKKEKLAAYESAVRAQPSVDIGVHVGGGIYVDHKKRLRVKYQVFEGSFQGEKVAVKRFDWSEKCRKDTEMMMSLKTHPNIVQFKAYAEFESKECPGTKMIYLAMELCDKTTLYELAKDETFSQGDRLRSLLDFTKGLSEIHRNDIIHGDLKPHSILRKLNETVMKIGEFAMSEKLEHNRTHRTVTVSQSARYGWVAPDGKLTKGSDVFAAGCIYYYVLSHGEALDQHRDFSKLKCDDVKIVASDLISRMTDLDAEKRPTAQECCESPLFSNMTE